VRKRHDKSLKIEWKAFISLGWRSAVYLELSKTKSQIIEKTWNRFKIRSLFEKQLRAQMAVAPAGCSCQSKIAHITGTCFVWQVAGFLRQVEHQSPSPLRARAPTSIPSFASVAIISSRSLEKD
jgi:hypothetical protein